MKELEKFAASRVRSGRKVWSNQLHITGNIIYAQYLHDASRSLDPQLHSHNVIVNCTFDSFNGGLKALSEYQMCKAIRYAGKTYQNALAAEVMKLGYVIDKKLDKKGNIQGFEIRGISEKMMETYSSRRKDIEEEIEKFREREGRTPSRKEIDVIARKTRDRKLAEISTEEVRAIQLSKLSSRERDIIECIKIPGNGLRTRDLLPDNVQEKISEVVEDLYERKSVLTADKILAEVLNQNLGFIDLEELKEELPENENLIRLFGDEIVPYFASRKNTILEAYIIDAVSKGKNTCKAFNALFEPFKKNISDASSQQKQAVKTLLSSTDRFLLFQGYAGSGKTSALHELCRGIVEGGEKNIMLIAPTNSAVAILKNEGFSLTQTVERFLRDKRNTLSAINSVLIVDEAGLNSVKQGADLMKFAERYSCRIIFAGDAKQHTSVEAGDFFRLIGEYTQITKATLSNIRRQKSEEYRKAVKSIAQGNVESAFDFFDSEGWIINGKGKYIKNAACDFVELTEKGKNLQKCLAVAPTNRECDLITEEIRKQLKEQRIIKGKGYVRKTFRSFSWTNSKKSKIANYKPGQEICIIKTLDNKKMSIGKTFRIKKVDHENITLKNGIKINVKQNFNQIEIGETAEIELCRGDLVMFTANAKKGGIINGKFALVNKRNQFKLLDEKGNIQKTIKIDKDFSALKYGFVTTSHKSQGQTKDNVVIAAESMDQKAFYVATSRGRENMRLHCPDKEILYKHIIKTTGDRQAALDMEADLKSLLYSSSNNITEAKQREKLLLEERIELIKFKPSPPKSDPETDKVWEKLKQTVEKSYVRYPISK